MKEKQARSVNYTELMIVRDWLSAIEEIDYTALIDAVITLCNHEGNGIAELWWDSDAEQWAVDWIKNG
jgi:hypothetical protein